MSNITIQFFMGVMLIVRGCPEVEGMMLLLLPDTDR